MIMKAAALAMGSLVILAPLGAASVSPASAQYYTPDLHYDNGRVERHSDDVWFYRQLDQMNEAKAAKRRAYDDYVDRMNDESTAERRHKEIMRTLRSIVDE